MDLHRRGILASRARMQSHQQQDFTIEEVWESLVKLPSDGQWLTASLASYIRWQKNACY